MSWKAAVVRLAIVELGVELAQLEVGRGDVGHEGQQDAAPRLLGREVLGEGRFVLPADATPQVELPRRSRRSADHSVMTGSLGVRRLVGADAAARPPAYPTLGKRSARAMP